MTLDYDQWHEHKTRPMWVRGHREELDALTADRAARVPDSAAAVHDWVRRYDSSVSRALKPDEPEGDDEPE